MLAAILVLFLLPYFQPTYRDIPPTQSPLYKLLFGLFILNFLILMFLGGQPAAAPFVLCSKFFTLTYFAYLLLALPFINLFETYALNVIKNGEKKRKSVVAKTTICNIPNKLFDRIKTRNKVRATFAPFRISP
jgi:ubiquinol-cytochrome c reductase cytochrome b subunit